MRFYLLLIIHLLSIGSVFAREFNYLHYDRKHGLEGAIVYCAAEDKDGFLWFGTENGIAGLMERIFKNLPWPMDCPTMKC
jgi:ligand-binding sensor domain-containing protein